MDDVILPGLIFGALLAGPLWLAVKRAGPSGPANLGLTIVYSAVGVIVMLAGLDLTWINAPIGIVLMTVLLRLGLPFGGRPPALWAAGLIALGFVLLYHLILYGFVWWVLSGA